MVQLIALLIALAAIILIVGFVMKLVKLGIALAVIVGIAALVYHFFMKKK
jgi:hypothetical protein